MASNQASFAECRDVLGKVRLRDGNQRVDVGHAAWAVTEQFQDCQSNGMSNSRKQASPLFSYLKIRMTGVFFLDHEISIIEGGPVLPVPNLCSLDLPVTSTYLQAIVSSIGSPAEAGHLEA